MADSDVIHDTAPVEPPAARLSDTELVMAEGREEAVRHLTGAAITAARLLEAFTDDEQLPGESDKIAMGWLRRILIDASEVLLVLEERRQPRWDVRPLPEASRALALLTLLKAEDEAEDEVEKEEITGKPLDRIHDPLQAGEGHVSPG